MIPYSTPRQIWRALYPMLIFMAVPTIVASVGMIFFLAGTIPEIMSETFEFKALYNLMMDWVADNTLLLTLIGQVLCFAPLLPIWSRTRKSIPLYRKDASPMLLAILSLLTFIGISLFTGVMLSYIDVGEAYEHIEEALSGGNAIVRILALVVAAPIIEELCFRGIILSRLLTWTKPWIAVLFQAALFGFAHMNLVQGVYAFAVGAILGFLYARFRKLWLCIVGHFAFNLPSTLFAFMEEGVEVNVLAVFIPGAILAAIGGYFLFKQPAAQPTLSEDSGGMTAC